MSPAWQWRFKWTVYTLLFINFLIYAYQDVESAQYTLGADPSLLQWTRAYLTTIDLTAWIVLIAFFELETGPLADRMRGLRRGWALRGVRLVCYVAILHTTYGNLTLLHDYRTPRALPAAADLCAYADGDWSYLENRGYTTIDPDNCRTIGRGPQFFAIDPEPVVTDRAGLTEATILAWTDVAENLLWVLIILCNEILVRMQARGIAGGTAVKVLSRTKVPAYALILCIAAYWGSKEQILYFWDEFLWVCGFLAIDGNLRMQRLRLMRVRSKPAPTADPYPG